MSTFKFLVRNPSIKTSEHEKALRDQLHVEIENKSKACSNSSYECTIPRIEGYEFCQRHILHDTRAPYKQCAYIYPNNKKCSQAAPKNDPKRDSALTNYCFEHSRLVQLTKTRKTIGKYKPFETNETLLNDLVHHVNVDKLNVSLNMDEEIDVVSPNVEPYVNYDQISDLKTVTQTVRSKKRILDYASDSSSDDDIPTLFNTSKVHEWENSDNESVDSQDEDLLKHAGIYTTEEATLITKQKMLKLQALYLDQINRLQHMLKEKRREYLQAIRKERETLCSIHDQPKETPQERLLYEKLKALNHYHKRHGIEAVLYKKFKEKRVKGSEGFNNSKGPYNQAKCIYTEGGVKCGEKILPSSKHCKKHILEDKKQTLFRACGVEKSGIVCQEPVPNIFEDSTCILHINLPPVPKNYTQKKYESETDDDDDDIIDKKYDFIKDDENLTAFSSVEGVASESSVKEEIVFDTMIVDESQDKESQDENITISHDNNLSKSSTDLISPDEEKNINTEIATKETTNNENLTISHDTKDKESLIKTSENENLSPQKNEISPTTTE